MRLASPYGAMGLASYAISALDFALWDLKGKLLRRPVFELLGGPARDKHRLLCHRQRHRLAHGAWLFARPSCACPFGPADGLAGLDGNEELVARTRATDRAEGRADARLLDGARRRIHRAPGRAAAALRPALDRGLPDARRPGRLGQRCAGVCPGRALATGEHWYTPAPFLAVDRPSQCAMSSSPTSPGSAA